MKFDFPFYPMVPSSLRSLGQLCANKLSRSTGSLLSTMSSSSQTHASSTSSAVNDKMNATLFPKRKTSHHQHPHHHGIAMPPLPESSSKSSRTSSASRRFGHVRRYSPPIDFIKGRTRAPILFFAVCCVTLTFTMSWIFCQTNTLLTTQRTSNWYAFYDDEGDADLWSPPWVNMTEQFTTPEEKDFPLAYSVLMYTDTKQALMLLRAIYRPQNHYCIHVDKKASPDVHILMRHWETHIPNLFVLRSPVHVIHSQFSTLEADLLCMRELLRRDKNWRYFINLTGQEYPRKTNLEMVRILKAMNGSNLMNKMSLEPNRVMKRYWYQPPHGITLWKGAVHIIVVRKFVEFALYDQRAIDLMEFIRDTMIPDESYFSTLNHNPQLQAPGGFKGDLMTGSDYPYVNRLKSWSNEYNQIPCNGVYVRLICIWGDNDFDSLTKEDDPTLIINKFIIPINGRLYRKIDRWFHERQARIYANPDAINVDYYYNSLPQRSNHF